MEKKSCSEQLNFDKFDLGNDILKKQILRKKYLLFSIIEMRPINCLYFCNL